MKRVRRLVAWLVSVCMVIGMFPGLGLAKNSDASTDDWMFIPAENWTVANQNENLTIDSDRKISIVTQVGDFAQNYQEPKNYWLSDAPEGDFTLTVKVSGGLNAHAQKIGLMAFDNWKAIASVTRRYHNGLGGNVFGMFQNLSGVWGENALSDTRKDTPAYLKLERKGNQFLGYYRYEDQQEWTSVGQLTNAVVGESSQMKIGVFAVNGSTNADIQVSIEEFTCNDVQIPFGDKVQRDALKEISVQAPQFLPLGGAGAVKVQGVRMDGQTADLSKAEIRYESDHPDVVEVTADGTLTAVGSGTAVITATVEQDGVTKEASATVMVDGEEDTIWTLPSPDGSIQSMFYLGTDGTVRYAVQKDGAAVVQSGTLGLITSQGDFTKGLSFEHESQITSVVDEYDLIGAKVSHVRAEGNEMELTFGTQTPGVSFQIVARAYDDGVAFQYKVSNDQESGGELQIHSEETTLGLPDGSTPFAMDYAANHQTPVNKYDSPAQLTGDYLEPLLYETAEGTWALMAEAGLNGEYCGTYFDGDGQGNVNYHFSKQQGNQSVVTTMPFASPWRFVVIGGADTITMNTMAETLSPDAQGDFSWVKPGVTSWTWLNGDGTSSYETYKRYVDLCDEMGWEYLLLDDGWQPSFGSYYDWFDDLLTYAKEKSVKLLVWVDHNKIKDETVRRNTFEEWAEMGIAGVKPDWFNNDSQTYMKLYDAIMEDAAAAKLLVNLHGCPQTYGERRTYPMMLTREGLLGGETPSRLTAFHNCMLPFTRMAVGPADYTPMFHEYSNVSFSVGQMAAMAVVYESGIQCLADRPDKYIGSPAEFFFKDLPASWDESVVLQADPGDLVTIARRNGENWYVGAMCNTQHDAVIDLDFLGEGEYYAVICKDGATKDTVVSEMKVVTRDQVLTIPMLEEGGAAVKILREKPSQPESISLDQTEVTMEQNDTAQLTATVAPEGTEVDQVVWSSSNESVVSVENGHLTAKYPGHAIITASTGFAGEVKAQCQVTVTAPAYRLTDEWEIVHPDADHWRLTEDGNVTIDSQYGQIYINGSSTVFNVKNLFLTPAEQGDFSVDVKLDFKPNENHQTAGVILFLDENNNFCVSRRFHSGLGGKVLCYHGVNNGNTTFVEEKIPDPSQEQAPVYLRITKKGTTLTAFYSLDRVEWTQIAEDIVYPGLEHAENLKLGLYVGNGSKDPSSPATFSDFVVTYEGQQAKNIPFAEQTVFVENVTLNQENGAVAIGQKLELQAEITPSNATYQNLEWSSSDNSVATVDENGVVTGVTEGTAIITVTSADGGKTDQCEVRVVDPENVDKSLLQKTYDYAKAQDTSNLVPSAKEKFDAVMAKALAVLEDETATQEQVNTTWNELVDVIHALGLVKGDKAMLELVIAQADTMMGEADKYVETNWKQLVDALETAQAVMDDADAMQGEVDEATSALLDAILAQRYKADKSILEDLIGKAEGMDLSGYTAESVSAFRAALAEAQAVLADETLSEDDQKTVDAAVEKLTAAMDGLTAGGAPEPSDKPEVTDKPEASDKPEATQKPGEGNVPQTGDHSQIILWVSLMGLCAVGTLTLVAVKGRRKVK